MGLLSLLLDFPTWQQAKPEKAIQDQSPIPAFGFERVRCITSLSAAPLSLAQEKLPVQLVQILSEVLLGGTSHASVVKVKLKQRM